MCLLALGVSSGIEEVNKEGSLITTWRPAKSTRRLVADSDSEIEVLSTDAPAVVKKEGLDPDVKILHGPSNTQTKPQPRKVWKPRVVSDSEEEYRMSKSDEERIRSMEGTGRSTAEENGAAKVEESDDSLSVSSVVDSAGVVRVEEHLKDRKTSKRTAKAMKAAAAMSEKDLEGLIAMVRPFSLSPSHYGPI